MAQSKSNTNVFVIGENDYNQLCINPDNKDINKLMNINEYHKNLDIKDVHIGYLFTIISTTDGEYYGVGRNEYGQIGLGHKDEKVSKPTAITFFADNHITIKTIYTSPFSHNVFWLTDNNQLYANGRNHWGQCGIDTNEEPITTPRLIQVNITGISDISIGYDTSYILDVDGCVRAAGEYGSTEKFEKIDTKTKFKSISSGGYHLLLISTTGAVYGYGHNKYGQLGVGDDKDRTDGPVQIEYFKEKEVTQISAGDGYSLVMDSNDVVYAFGRNDKGQLGIGNTTNQSLPVLIKLSQQQKITSICAGYFHSMISNTSGQSWIFGENENNICSLVGDKDIGDKVTTPYLITEQFQQETNNQYKILNIKLGYFATLITAIKRKEKLDEDDMKEMDDEKEINTMEQEQVNILRKQVERV